MDDIDQLAANAVAGAAATLGRARRHAVWLERIAVSILAFGLVSTAFLVVGDGALLWSGLTAALGTLAAWGALRAIALLLHLRVDETMVELGSTEAG